MPTFAPIAAVIVLGLAVSERGRRAVDMTLGVAFGVAIADLLVSVVGVGAEASIRVSDFHVNYDFIGRAARRSSAATYPSTSALGGWHSMRGGARR